ncbi:MULTISPECIES: GPW/gp25 family protein [Photorhabdus]|uniref:Baseplate assembly protein n=3 Tax=Photorhabdus TaxID=29487 RepID=A0A329XBR6_9GAMM|nr:MULTISPECIES: GPW/gp25 family protein [Photorhabdus]AKH63184.1 baseplate assembly protein [Photorhabdus thracensis]MCC8421397.1 GPW/gp25 family protein [Photorhabdus thracensis]NDL00687.1 baseplate assembly protein [Photorhabdus bodei]NDL04853.1 baseplate assembly protein [Photorhabdus bodei]NDL09186.1 baseplate assembly protein [Photorhabdus bodei]
MMYLGMNRQTGEAISDIAHVRQSVSDILLTPMGSRITRRQYGSLLSELIDAPQNPALRLQIMAACYTAIQRWEPRITLTAITINQGEAGYMTVDISGQYRLSNVPVAFSVPVG